MNANAPSVLFSQWSVQYCQLEKPVFAVKLIFCLKSSLIYTLLHENAELLNKLLNMRSQSTNPTRASLLKPSTLKPLQRKFAPNFSARPNCSNSLLIPNANVTQNVEVEEMKAGSVLKDVEITPPPLRFEYSSDTVNDKFLSRPGKDDRHLNLCQAQTFSSPISSPIDVALSHLEDSINIYQFPSNELQLGSNSPSNRMICVTENISLNSNSIQSNIYNESTCFESEIKTR